MVSGSSLVLIAFSTAPHIAMPKCASTALENALSARMDMVLSGAPGMKHTTYRKFDRFLRPYLQSYTKEPFEVLSLFREPVDWLHSWWRYRGREGIPNPENSTRDMSFPDFVTAYLDDQRKPADVGRQARFVAAADGSIGVDTLFRYDRIEAASAYLENRLKVEIALQHTNVSPGRQGAPDLMPELRADVEQGLADEYEIYRTHAR